MKTKEILCGTKRELVEHFYNIVKDTEKMRSEKNLLYSKDGIEGQLDAIDKDRKGIGIIFYMTIKEETGAELHMELNSSYVHIDAPAFVDEKTMPTDIKI